jgi:hypothetical protein
MNEAGQNLLTEQKRVDQPADNVANNIVNNPNYLFDAITDWLKPVLQNGVTQTADHITCSLLAQWHHEAIFRSWRRFLLNLQTILEHALMPASLS